MPHWMIKAVVQKTISVLPGSRSWNHLFQTYLTRSLDLDHPEGLCPTRFDYKLLQCRRHIENYTSHVPHPAGFSALELGTGWNPIVPIGLYLCGAAQIWTADQESMLTLRRVRDVVDHFIVYAGRADLQRLLPQVDAQRLAALAAVVDGSATSPAALLKSMNIHILAGDAQQTGLAPSSVDLIVSNNTLEHIPLPALTGIFREFRRLSSPSTLMSHFIDMSDHYVNVDSRLSPYNFLRYSATSWRWLNNSLQYLNRLRISDYRSLHQAAGFAISHEDSDRGSASRLAGVPLAPEFQRYSREDVAVTASWLVSVPT